MYQARLLPNTSIVERDYVTVSEGLKAISLFSGAGGMDVGFTKAGFNIVWANDIDKDSCETYAHNHGDIIRHGDVHDFFSEFEEHKEIDLVFGGPPCQGFSVAGKMDPTDARSKHVFTFMDVIEKVRPKVFVMENVKALGALSKWSEIRNELQKRADSMGYKDTKIIILNATDFNVPQKRERMFFIGVHEQEKTDFANIENLLSKYKKSPASVGEIFRELGEAGSENNNRTCRAKITLAVNPILRRSPYAGMLFNGAGRPINVNGYANTLPASMGGNKTPIVDENEVFNGKKSWLENYHSHLMKGEDIKFKEVPKFLRRLTVDEALRIQTFPDNYIFAGKQNSIYRQIGNAVPCELAYAVASTIKELID